MVVSSSGAGVADVAGESCQRVVLACLHIQGIRCSPAGIRVFAVDILTVIEVVGRGCRFGLLDAPPLVVVAITGGGDGVDLDLVELVKAVPAILVNGSAGAGAVAGPCDSAAAAFLALLTAVIVEAGFQQCAAKVVLPDFGQLVSGIKFIGSGTGHRVAELLLDPVVKGIVGVALLLRCGAVVDLGKAIERVVTVGISQRGLARESFLVSFASAQAVIAIAALSKHGGGVFVADLALSYRRYSRPRFD